MQGNTFKSSSSDLGQQRSSNDVCVTSAITPLHGTERGPSATAEQHVVKVDRGRPLPEWSKG
jgi:hypothetical protein